MSAVTASLGLSAQEVKTVVQAASLAPSLHNSQPWRFRLLPDRIEVHMDLGRRLPGADPEDRELRRACGAALLNLRLALQGLGIRPSVTLLPPAVNSVAGAVAVVRRGGPARPTDELNALLNAIRTRRTNRRPFLDQPIPRAHRQRLARAAAADQGWLHVVTGLREQAQIRDFVIEAHRIQCNNPLFLSEWAAWTGYHDAKRRDGVPAQPGGPLPEPEDQWVLRDPRAEDEKRRPAGKDFDVDPVVFVLCSYYDGKLAELQSGQSMQRVLLTAATLGLSASFLPQPVEVPRMRDELRRLLGGGLVPQSILRIGYATPAPPTPRRPVEDLVMPGRPGSS
jgi:nitroreductase